MEKDYPFATDYAKSNRSSCKSCKDIISKDSLRMAVMIQSHHFDGKVPNWYHFNCFFKKSKVVKLEDIKDFDSLRWEDQEKIKTKLDSNLVIDVKEADFSIEYAKSNRSKCGKCDEKIDKSEIRFSREESDNVKVKMLSSIKRWYHIACLVQMKDDILKSVPNFDIEKISGFDKLTDDDKQELIKKFKSWKSKKRSNDNVEKGTAPKKIKCEDEFDKKLKEQNEMIWNLRDKLNKEVSKNALKELLEENKQFVPKGESNLLDSVADCMAFGCLNACPECGGMLSYSSNSYKCRSMINEWTKCTFQTREVTRSPFIVSEEYLDADILRTYSYKPNVRILPAETVETEVFEPLKGYSVTVDKIPLGGGYSSAKVKKRIKELGGQALSTILPSTLVLISSKNGESGRRKSLINMAKSESVDVVSVDFLENLDKVNLIDVIKKYSIADWGRSIEALTNLKNTCETVSENKFIDQKKDLIQVVTVKGGAAVDPDSGLEKKAHLYQDPKTQDPLNAILGMADLVRGSNSFYKLQLLESDKKKRWWVFRAWGRIGTVIGGNKLDQFDDLEEAIDNFQSVYLDKTGNHWKNRKSFQKHPNKFSPIDVDYGEGANKMDLAEEDPSSELPQALQNLIRFIFDMASMKKAMLEFEIDLNRMPLGKLSKNQIDLSYNVLKELQDILNKSAASKHKLLELSNRFYTMMPHNFGMRTPPLIDSLDMVKEKCDMIESLMELEVAYKLMKVENGANSVDGQYKKLQNNIGPLDKNSDEYKRLETYLQNSHAPTHNYKIQIIDIYDVDRQGESDRFHSFKKLPNRMMLWHGSRRTNWAGILSQGLRIAPPEAPVTGYMFGKGLYFADMVSKSANYCHTSSDSPDGLLLLCEVALGTMAERFKADTNIVLKKGEHSCKGVGQTMCDPTGNFVDKDGILYPMGKPVQQVKKSTLLYNEYIVYDIGQVRQRYLFKVKFQYD